MLIHILILILCFWLIAVICDEYFVKSLDLITERLKLPSDVAGATLMAVGSSAPELFISIFALIKPGGYENVGAGTIVGSALFNILVIVGASSLFKTAKLTWQPVLRDMLFYIISIVALYITFVDGMFEFKESLGLVFIYVVYIYSVFKWKSWFPYKDANPIDIVEKQVNKNPIVSTTIFVLSYVIPKPSKKNGNYLKTFLLSVAFLAFLSYFLVESGVSLGHSLNINPTIIALTILAAGTSVPDLVSSVIVAKRGKGDMAVANAVGSNIFDILIGLGVPMMLVLGISGKNISIDNNNLIGSIILLFATVVAIFTILLVKKWKIGKRAGLLLIILYLAYVLHSALSAI